MTTIGTELDDLLTELLAEPHAHMIERTRTEYDRLADLSPDQVVVFGAGQLGRFLLPAMRRAGIEPLAYCDNNPRLWGAEIEGVVVLPPAEAVQQYRDRACFLAAIYNASPVARQLRDMGCNRVVPYPAFFWKYSEHVGDERLDLPHRILAQAAEMAPAYDLLADETSRREFCTQLRWRCLLDYSCLPRNLGPADMYFPEDLFALGSDEVFVDCGAFDGDSLRSFIERVDGQFQHVYAVEPDPANIAALRSYIATLRPEQAGKIAILPYALSRQDGMVRFAADGSVGSRVVDAGGTVELECRNLRSALGSGPRPTFVKMDIEGAEIEAIPGAADVLSDCRPVMAVCAYHHCSDLWVLPKLLKAANPDYKIFLRRYAEECWETVFYAVPPERLRDRQ